MRRVPTLPMFSVLFYFVLLFSNSAHSNFFTSATDYYSIDGSNNNLNFPSWGQRGTPRVRLFPNASGYFDLQSIPSDENNAGLPSARQIMEDLFSQSTSQKNKGVSHMMLEFGHFIVQDIIGRTLLNETDSFPIPCDGDIEDIVFCPVTGKNYSISFARSQHLDGSQPRASLNGETSFMDMSNLYGSTLEKEAEVRSFEGGRLILDEEELPPILDRYNSSPGVFAVYCIFMRYHNIMADRFAAENPNLSDDEIYQMARQRNIAIYQFNAEEKYIPTLLGSKLRSFEGYDPTVDPSVDEFFAAASFRYAHTSFSGIVRLMDKDFNPTSTDPLILRDVFRQPSPNNVPRLVQRNGGIEPFLRGLTVQNAKATDVSFVHDLNYFTEATSLLDIQRGRDLGLPSYNKAREAFGLDPAESFADLTGYDHNAIGQTLKNLYGDVNNVDAYVGALVEARDAGQELGPLFTLSIKNQFERTRDGDRLWYRNLYTSEEFESFPSLSEIIKETCEGMKNFPSESFIAWDGIVESDETAETCGASTQLSLIGGKFSLGWAIEVPSPADISAQPDLKRSIEVNLVANDRMNKPGFIGVGWRSQVMKGAEIWWCTVDGDVYAAQNYPDSFPASCDIENKIDYPEKLFSCCVTPGELHVQPVCSNANDNVYYELTVVDWCLTPTSSRVTVSATVCDDDEEFADGKVNCFRTESSATGEMDFIVAYNNNRIGNHGYQMRTGAAVDLSAGILTQSEAHVADTGLIATHAVFMLIGWGMLAPMAIFIVRYMKTRSWRLVAHVSLMGVVGSMMVPLLIGVEASVGATDKTQEHSAVGLFLLGVYFAMVFAGRVRYLKLEGRKVGRKTYFFSTLLHKYGGVVMVLLAWWNCYTGLVRIGPEDSYFQVIVLSSFPLGYDLPIFGYIRRYVFFPYLGFVCFIFICMEARHYRLNNSSHAEKLRGILEGKETIWEEDADKFLDKMTMENFLEATKLGSALCIVDGYVLDITSFVENHPGGQHLLRYAAGSDITEEFVGARDVDGSKHVHSRSALQLMKTFVTAVLVDTDNKKLSFLKGADSRAALSQSSGPGSLVRSVSLSSALSIGNPRAPASRRGASVFRRGRVVGMRYLTPDIEITHTSKPVILLQLALPKVRRDLHVQKLISLPSCAFTFRGIDRNRAAVDRQYTPIKINNDYTGRRSHTSQDKDEEVFDFVISLVPSGKMTKILLDTRMGKMMLAQGPTVNQETVKMFRMGGWKSVVMIAAGTGVSPMLQVIDFYLSRLSSEFSGAESTLQSECPYLYLMWIVKSPKYNYSETLALDTRVQRSGGKFKYMVIYSTSKGKREADTENTKSTHGWTFKQIVDKTLPSRHILAGSIDVSEKLGLRRPKKVKRHVVDAAWKSKRGTSFRGLPKKPNLAQTGRSGRDMEGSKAFNDTTDEGNASSDDASIHNEITEESWLRDEVQTSYRSYSKMLLEELLLSIPDEPEPPGFARGVSSGVSSCMPSIVEEDSCWDSANYDDSDLLSSSELPLNTGESTHVSENNPDSSQDSMTSGSTAMEDPATLQSQNRVDFADAGAGPAPAANLPRSSWLPPRPGAVKSVTPVVRSLEEARRNTTSKDEQCESFDHKQIKRDHSPTRVDMAGNLIVLFDNKSQSVSSEGFATKKPSTQEQRDMKPEAVKPQKVIAPEPRESKQVQIQATLERNSLKAGPPSRLKDSVSSSSKATNSGSILKKERPKLNDQGRQDSSQISTSQRPWLKKETKRVEEVLDELEITEEEYRRRKILVAISGAPMFEYKTRVNLSDLGFPKDQMVTFHASAQQL